MYSNAHSQRPPHLELRILTSHVGLYPQPPAIITNDTLAQSTMMTTNPDTISPSDFTRLLSGPLADFLSFCRQENSQWLIDIAHDMCDPTLRRGSLQVRDEAGQMWKKVNPTDPLTASTYLYDVQAMVSLSKISARAGNSKSSASSNASTMANGVKDRDGQRCWVTRSVYPITNSHVCPKRMGDHLLGVVYNTFVSSPPPPALSIYDEICGITLIPNLETLFHKYELGLRFVAPVRKSSFLVFYSKSLVHELRMSTNVISFPHLIGHKSGDAQYMQPGKTCPNPSPLYMGTELVPPSPNTPATRHLV